MSRLNLWLGRLRWLAHPLALIPLAWLIWRWSADGLTANPIQFITHKTGKTALNLLVLSLAISPLRRATRLTALAPLRKWLGLWGFFYASLHLTIFIGLDYFFDWQLLWLELSEKRYVLVGFTAWLILIPLASTSTKGWQRRLTKRWKRLHLLAYAVTPLVVIHFTWLVKSDYREPAVYGVIVFLLLLSRLKPLTKRLAQRQSPPIA